MEYTKKDLGSFGLHMIHTNKFKTITVRVIFHTPIKKEEITKRSLLADILLQSSSKYDSKRSLTIQAEDLYSADLGTNNRRLGNYLLTSFSLDVLNDKYTEEGNFEKSVEFLSEIIFHPDICDGSFRDDKLDIVKNNAMVGYDSLKEDSVNYSLIRMGEAYDKNSPVSYRIMGYKEDLESIDGKNLYQAYQKMIDNDYVDIFVVGDFYDDEMLSIIKKYFKFKKIKKQKESYYLEEKKISKRRLFAKEVTNNSQSKLAIACSMNHLNDYDRNCSLVLANIILGGGPDSKLFQEVREKNSLCYTIHSYANKMDNLFVITAGIDKDNFHKTVDLVTECITDMRKGKFSDREIEIAKEFCKTSVEELEESKNRIIFEFFMRDILGLEPIDVRLEKILKVTKQDIMKVCKKINMDTVFLLEGVYDEED